MQISELSIFDLDDTILRIPSYTSKKFLDTYLGHTYLDTPYSFYDNEVSLDESIYDIYLIELHKRLTQMKKDRKKAENDTQLLDNRLKLLKNEEDKVK